MARKPWIATIIALIFGPVIGAAYLNRGRLALFYLLLLVLALCVTVVGHLYGSTGSVGSQLAGLLGGAIALIGAIQCYLIAKRRLYSEPFGWYARRWYLIVAGALIPVLVLYLFPSYTVPTPSMAPSLSPGDLFVASRLAFLLRPPERGDVIVFKSHKQIFIKRIVGLPGDTVEMKNGAVILNGLRLPTEKSEDFTEPQAHDARAIAQSIETNPNGRKYRILNTDSSGPFDNVAFRTVAAESYFVLGDNRDKSADSRMARMGSIPRSDIIGKAVAIVRSGDDSKIEYKPVD